MSVVRETVSWIESTSTTGCSSHENRLTQFSLLCVNCFTPAIFSTCLCQTSRPRMCADFPKALHKVDDDILRDRVVIGVLDDETRHKLLAQADLTLDGAICICRAEVAAKQTEGGMSSPLGVHFVKSTYKRQKSQSKSRLWKSR